MAMIDSEARADASEAKQVAYSVKSQQNSHEAVCAERYTGLTNAIADLKSAVASIKSEQNSNQKAVTNALWGLVITLMVGVAGLFMYIATKGG
jgi:hypothetical protein